MYHQFKQLAGIDITKESMEVGPTTHYVMGGVRVDPDTQMSRVPGLFAAGECAGGLHGANRLGGNSLSDLLVFGKRAGEHAAAFAKEHAAGVVNTDQVGEIAQWALQPFSRAGEGPYAIQQDLQVMMQGLVGIVRQDTEIQKALDGLVQLNDRTNQVSVVGHREYNNGWHTALDLRNLLTVSEAVARAAIMRQESRGAHFREDYLAKDNAWGKQNIVIRKAPDGVMQVSCEPIPQLRTDLVQIIEDNR
jgi:succinate dehydrogenase / fumarate reductase flavoprotein subunit